MKKSFSTLQSFCILCLFIFVSGLISCTSGLSTEKITDISLLYAEIEITQNPFDKKDNSVVVRLLDRNGNRVSNDSLTIFVNGIEEKLSHDQGLYYINKSKYISSNVPVKDLYNVEVKLSDEKKYFLGSIKALAEENPENIALKNVGDINNDFEIKWHNLIDIDELSVFIGMTEQTSPTVTTTSNQPEKIIAIKNNGIFTVPKSAYKDKKATINGIEFTFRTTKVGKTNPKLLENSKITITTSIEKYVAFD